MTDESTTTDQAITPAEERVWLWMRLTETPNTVDEVHYETVTDEGFKDLCPDNDSGYYSLRRTDVEYLLNLVATQRQQVQIATDENDEHLERIVALRQQMTLMDMQWDRLLAKEEKVREQNQKLVLRNLDFQTELGLTKKKLAKAEADVTVLHDGINNAAREAFAIRKESKRVAKENEGLLELTRKMSQAIDWDTTCVEHGKLLSQLRSMEEERDQQTSLVNALRERVDSLLLKPYSSVDGHRVDLCGALGLDDMSTWAEVVQAAQDLSYRMEGLEK